jgi:hypothetical protein
MSDLISKLSAEADALMVSAWIDQSYFNTLRRIASLHGGVYIIHGEEVDGFDGECGATVIGVPTETICYSLLAYGCDERDALDKYIKEQVALR